MSAFDVVSERPAPPTGLRCQHRRSHREVRSGGLSGAYGQGWQSQTPEGRMSPVALDRMRPMRAVRQATDDRESGIAARLHDPARSRLRRCQSRLLQTTSPGVRFPKGGSAGASLHRPHCLKSFGGCGC